MATHLSHREQQRLQQAYSHAKQPLILLDYDGTLHPFVSSPEPNAAAPSADLLRLLQEISKSSALAIVSGRPQSSLERWFGALPILLAAEHSAWLKINGSWTQNAKPFGDHKNNILAVLRHYQQQLPGSLIEQKEFAIVWHYRQAQPGVAKQITDTLRQELDSLLANTPFTACEGAKIIEIKSRTINKGVAAHALLAQYSPDFILCIGDDYTDEDMFCALPPSAYTVKVGVGPTVARFRISSVKAVLDLLLTLV